nr:MAG TPA: zinc-ribbon protein [Caudoviricetes sp.]
MERCKRLFNGVKLESHDSKCMYCNDFMANYICDQLTYK